MTIGWWTEAPSRQLPIKRFLLALAAMSLVLVAPLALVDVPPLLDYPNHLARAVALANTTDPFLSQFYVPNWAIIPDLGIDIVLPPLLQVLPVHVAGRIVIAAFVVLPVLGTVAYSRAAFGRFGWWSLGAGMVAWNQATLLGFLNFAAGIGLGFLLAAAWIAWRDRHPRRALSIAVLGTPVIFFCHLMGLVCFALLIGCYELCAVWSVRSDWLRRIALAAMPFIVPGALYLLSPLGELAGDASYDTVIAKLAQLIVPVQNYLLALDVATAVITVAVAGFGLLATLGRFGAWSLKPAGVSARLAIGSLIDGRIRQTASALALVIAVVLFLVAPTEFKGVAHFDMRFIVMAGFLIFGALRPEIPRAVYLFLGLVFAGRMLVLAVAWAGQTVDLADLRTVIAEVPPGRTVLLATDLVVRDHTTPLGRHLSSGDSVMDHMPALLPIERRAWWQSLFDNPSQQPIATRKHYRALALRSESMARPALLATADLCGFDYVLVMQEHGAPALDPSTASRLTPIAQAGFAEIFLVDPAKCSGP